MAENQYAERLYGARRQTDCLWSLGAGALNFQGILMDTARFIEREQLLDEKLWTLFVNQFRRSVDDADHGWRCEYWGKMMRGAVFTYEVTGSEPLYRAMERTVRDLLTAQDGDGRFSSYSREVEFHGWDLWGRKYILLGLEYFLEICRDEALAGQVLEAMKRHADYIVGRIGDEKEGKIEINTATDHWGGLNSSSILEPFVRLYSLTGEKRYLDFADYIVSRGGCTEMNLFEMAYEDRLAPYQYPFTKAYEMMSCFEGLAEYARVTGSEKWKQAVVRFAYQAAKTDITVIGCAGCTHELFDHSAVRQLDATEKGIMQETCVTVTWMKLCLQALGLSGDAFFADCIEQSMYNALLGAVNTKKCETNGGLPFDSYSPLLPGVRGRMIGGFKVMEEGAFYGCCAAIGAAGTGFTGRVGVMAHKNGLAVNLFLDGKVQACTPSGQFLSLITRTGYPADGLVETTVCLAQEERFEIWVRVPAWSGETLLSVNGETVPCEESGYAVLDRVWKNGDVIRLSLDMRVRRILPEVYGVSSDDAPYAAFCRGPLTLARDARLGEDVDAPVRLTDEEAALTAPVPFAAQVTVAVPLEGGRTMRLIDYASAGKTWDCHSRMAAWIPVAR